MSISLVLRSGEIQNLVRKILNNPVDSELNFLYCAILVNRGVLNLILQAATR